LALCDALQEASIAARILRLVDAHDFTEKRNKAVPTLYQRGFELPEVDFEVELPDYAESLPLAGNASDLPSVFGFEPFEKPTFEIWGYDYSPELQPSIVEIWSEAEDSILHTLADSFGINYVPGLGFASLTAIKTMLRRIEASGKEGFSMSLISTQRARLCRSLWRVTVSSLAGNWSNLPTRKRPRSR
jgi:hypothetical protein